MIKANPFKGIVVRPNRLVRKRNRAMMVNGELHVHPKVYKWMKRPKRLQRIFDRIRVTHRMKMPKIFPFF